MAKLKLSDNQLTLLLMVAIFISLVSTLTIYQLGTYKITGYQTTPTSEAQANLTVESQVGCDFIDNFIDLGSVPQDESNNSDIVVDYWVIQNTGTENVTVNISVYNPPSGWLFTSATACGGDCQAETQYWQYYCNQSQSLSGICLVSSYTDVRALMTEEIALTGLESGLTYHNATFGVNATVPSGESSGSKYGDVQARCVVV